MRSLRLVFSVAVLIAFLSGCGKKEKLTPFPLENGDEFVYENINYIRMVGGREVFNIPFQHVYRIKSRESGNGFMVEFIVQTTDENGKILDYNISEEQGSELFDKYGRITGRTKRSIGSRLMHNFAKFWLPPSKRKNGAKLRFSINILDWNVTGPVKWEKWNAWKVTCGAKNSKTVFYFDEKTGFMVGDGYQHLIKTNKKEVPTAKSKVPEAIEQWNRLYKK